MTQFKVKQPNANERYLELQNNITFQIQILQKKLRKHEEDQKKDQTNWGYVGDIGHVNELLEKINSFLSNEK